jgi:hypothetical protein
MKKDEIFFGEAGLTSTSANFIANLAKETYSTIEKSLQNMTFYTTTFKLIGTEKEELLKQGDCSVDEVLSSMEKIAGLKTLIAWLREAIKAKERLTAENNNHSYEYYGIEVPERPVQEDSITADDYIATLNIKQRNRYYYLESFCSTIGEYIHPNGAFSKQRDSLAKAIAEPNYIQGEGRDTILYTKTPTVSQDTIEEKFMELQQEYRQYQAELNSIKHEIETAVNEDIQRKNVAFEAKVTDYQEKMAVTNATLRSKKLEELDRVSKLKIIIPDNLKSIYDIIQNLGKK